MLLTDGLPRVLEQSSHYWDVTIGGMVSAMSADWCKLHALLASHIRPPPPPFTLPLEQVSGTGSGYVGPAACSDLLPEAHRDHLRGKGWTWGGGRAGWTSDQPVTVTQYTLSLLLHYCYVNGFVVKVATIGQRICTYIQYYVYKCIFKRRWQLPRVPIIS
jgi:hypothetical protein